MTHLPQIAFIIPVRNRRNYTKNILTQLTWQIKQENRQGVSIIVVDDGSTDGTKEMIQTQFSSVFLIEADGSMWWAGAIVKGMEYAINALEADYLVWLNDDICITDNFINNLIKICDSGNYDSTVVGGIVLDQTYTDWIVYSGLKDRKPVSHINAFSTSDELEADVLCGNIVVIPRKIVDQVGFPDTVKLPHHGSDYEYSMRVKKAGFRVIFSCNLKASTDYTISDFTRYMPYWMQWYLQPDLASRWKIIKGLTSLKANQNIWLIVNLHSQNREKQMIPIWNYLFCYINKVIRFLIVDFLPKDYIQSRIQNHLREQNPPAAIIEAVIQRKVISEKE
ncbi:glycosyltransferase family 2 protein [Coleofasciculus sp. F4-SAH-05]|uniref:glycosyltransferase family 2 protein n=1 Tax=Coleofasciculus sp. F4-SAH-05 TaxID=3069525 RepID=UPI0032F6FBB3